MEDQEHLTFLEGRTAYLLAREEIDAVRTESTALCRAICRYWRKNRCAAKGRKMPEMEAAWNLSRGVDMAEGYQLVSHDRDIRVQHEWLGKDEDWWTMEWTAITNLYRWTKSTPHPHGPPSRTVSNTLNPSSISPYYADVQSSPSQS
jgi:hypothetical protein